MKAEGGRVVFSFLALCQTASLCGFQTHRSSTWFWSSSASWPAPLWSPWPCCWCGWPTVAGQSGRSTRRLRPGPAVAVCAKEATWSYHDQGGPTANYTHRVLTKIATDNYISQQTEEQSIILAIQQRRRVISVGIGQTRGWGAIQFTLLVGDTAVAVKFHT